MSSVDLTRFSQKALPIAKMYDRNQNGSLDDNEYKEFKAKWDNDYPTASPFLMQLHTKTLSPEAFHIAETCEGIDEYEGILTGLELKLFMDKCEQAKIEFPFKDGTSLKTVLTGENDNVSCSVGKIFERPNNFVDGVMVRTKLLENWLKLDIMNFKGSDKFFHAVGNYEAMKYGNESTVKKVCAGQDADKRKASPRAEEEYTDDLYANFLGREFAKMYPYGSAHDMMKPLAPNGFDVQKSKENVADLISDNNQSISDKLKQYFGYLREKYIRERCLKEVLENVKEVQK